MNRITTIILLPLALMLGACDKSDTDNKLVSDDTVADSKADDGHADGRLDDRTDGDKTDVKKVYGIGLDDRAIFLGAWRERAIVALDAEAIKNQSKRAEALKMLKESWTGNASVDSVGYRITRAYMYTLYDILYDGANDELVKLDSKANMATVSSRNQSATAETASRVFVGSAMQRAAIP